MIWRIIVMFCFIYRRNPSTLLNRQVCVLSPFQNSMRDCDYMTLLSSCYWNDRESQYTTQVQVQKDRKEVKAHGMPSTFGSGNQQLSAGSSTIALSILPDPTKSSEILSFINVQLTCNAQRVETWKFSNFFARLWLKVVNWKDIFICVCEWVFKRHIQQTREKFHSGLTRKSSLVTR